MSVWDSIVGQRQVVEQLKTISCGDPKSIAQSWLICGPPAVSYTHLTLPTTERV